LGIEDLNAIDIITTSGIYWITDPEPSVIEVPSVQTVIEVTREFDLQRIAREAAYAPRSRIVLYDDR
jgi:hypothetical protein